MVLPVPRWQLLDWLTQQHLWRGNCCLVAEINKQAPRALQEEHPLPPGFGPLHTKTVVEG